MERKKHIFLTFICCLSMMCSLFIPVFASDPYYFNIPEPQPDFRNFYFVNDLYLFEFKFLGNGFSSGEEAFLQQTDRPYDIVLKYNQDSTIINFYAYNYTFEDVDVACFVYNKNGSLFGSPVIVTLEEAGYVVVGNNMGYLDPYVFYVRSSNRTQVPSYSFNCNYDESFLLNDIANVLWNDYAAQHSDFVYVQNLLNDIYTLEGTINYNQSTYFTLIGKFLQDFFYEDNLDHNVVIYNWAYYCERMEHFSYNMHQFAMDFNSWYTDYYIPKTDLTNTILLNILDALTTDLETQPNMENQTEMASAVDQYEQAEGQIMGEADSYVNNIDNVIGGFDTDLNTNSVRGAFQFFNYIFNNFIQNNVSLFLLIPLIFGLICLVLGRHVQRG